MKSETKTKTDATTEKKPATKPKRPKQKKPRGKGKAKPASEALTMGVVAEGYLAHLDEAGKSPGTLFSYRQDIQTAVRHVGEDADVAALTANQVAEYFASDAVTKTRTGRTKAKPTVDKTRRVRRLALVWAAKSGLIAEAPIPTAPAKS